MTGDFDDMTHEELVHFVRHASYSRARRDVCRLANALQAAVDSDEPCDAIRAALEAELAATEGSN